MQMVLSQRLQWRKIGLLKPTRNFCTSAVTTPEKTTGISIASKKSEAAKEQRAVAVESFVKKYLEIHPGVFPKASHVRNEVGGSWYIVKDILKELKEKIISIPHMQTQTTSEKLEMTATVDTTDFETSKETLGTAVLSKMKGRVQTSEDAAVPLEHEKDILTIPTLVTAEKSSLEANLSTVLAPNRDQEVDSTSGSFLIQGLVSGDRRETKSVGASGSNEVTLTGNGVCSSSKSVTWAPSGSYKTDHTTSSSDREEKVRLLSNLFQKNKADGKLADNGTLTHETSPGMSKELSGNDPARKDIMGLINRIKELNVNNSQTRSHDHINSSKLNRLNHGGISRDRSSKHGIYDIFTASDRNKQEKSLREPSIPEREGTLIKKNENYTCDGDEKVEGQPEKVDFEDQPEKVDFEDQPEKVDFEDQPEKVDFEDQPEKVDFEEFISGAMSDVECGDSSDGAASDYITLKPSPHIPHQHNRVPQKKDPSPILFTEKGRDQQTNILVRFLLKSANVTEIEAVFSDCGPITGIHFIPSTEDRKFKDAYIYFKTKEGLRKALAKTDVNVGGADVLVASADPLTNMTNKIVTPDLIGNLEVPVSLIENPTRTVMLLRLPHDLATHDLREVLSFCGGRITGFFKGSSNSVAYVEFETEDAKEKAIAASTISLSGKQVSILRIDTPRTTVVRINNVGTEYEKAKIRKVCSKRGEIKRVTLRGFNTVDVHFKLAEWPNMVNILNSLNGLLVNKERWIAFPAPIIPVEILPILWSQSDGREHVCSLIRKLSGELEKNPLSTSDLCRLANQLESI